MVDDTIAELRRALMRQVWDSTSGGQRLDTLAVANGVLGNPELLNSLAAHQGWRPPALVVETVAELDALDWPCTVREIPVKDELVFYPQIWERAFQADGWNRAGQMHDESDCAPRLPVEVIPEGERRG